MGKSKKSKPSDGAPGQGKVVCFFCDGEFAEEGVLILHQERKHFKCTECSGFVGGRCPTHGCRHKCLVTLSCHYKKDHKAELKTIPGAKEGRDDPNKFYGVYGIGGTPADFVPAVNMETRLSIPANGPSNPEPELPPIPDQPPLPPMPLPECVAEWNMPAPTPDQIPLAPWLGLQGDVAIGGVNDAEAPPPSNAPEVPDFGSQVQAWMAAKEAADAEAKRSHGFDAEQAPPMSFLNSAASFPAPSGGFTSFPSDAFQSDSSSTTLAKIPDVALASTYVKYEDWANMEPKEQRKRSRSRDRQDRDRRSRSRDRSDRAAYAGQGSRSTGRQSSSRGTFHHDRDRQEDRMRDDRGMMRSSGNASAAGGAGRNCAIAITQGNVPSRLWLQQLMSPYGRLEYSHTGNRLNPERDPPWVLFATTGAAEDAMKAIGAGTVYDSTGVVIKGEWKKMVEKGKGKGKSKGDHMDISSRDLYGKMAADGRRPDARGSRGDDRRRSRRSTSSSSKSSRRNRGRLD